MDVSRALISFTSISLGTLIQATAVAVIIYIFVAKKYRKRAKDDLPKLTEEEKEEIIANWRPQPLVPDDLDASGAVTLLPKLPTIEGKARKYITLDGRVFFNMATMDFLGFIGDQRIEECAKKTISKYGVGSCGPRTFYGTVDVHIDLEKQLAEFLGCEETILYSYGFATIASSIPAYAKRGDVLFVDKGVNFAIQKGIQASRSRVVWFEHNDMDDLERLLLEHQNAEKKNPKKSAKTRLFMIVEGLYAKTADLCPLPKLIELKWRYKVRIFMDESLSFGVVGQRGRGLTEHFGVDVIDIDMIMVSLENALATTGGFCAGRKYLIEHQRLAGLGYVFSGLKFKASLPPLLATAASKALQIMVGQPERFERLRGNAKALHDALSSACEENAQFVVLGYDLCPLKYVALNQPTNYDANEQEAVLDALVEELSKTGILVTRARYLDKDEAFPFQKSVKVTCTSEMSKGEIESALEKLKAAIRIVSKR